MDLRSGVAGVAFFLAMAGMCLPQVQPSQQTGGAITLNVANLDLPDFLRLVQQASGLSIVTAPNVHGSVTAAFHDVPAQQALDSVLRANGLVGQRDGNVVTVVTLADATRQAQERLRLAQASLAAAPVTTCTYTLSYASASDAMVLLLPLLSSRGRIAVDLRNNMLIVTDLPQVLEKIGILPETSGRGECF
jgi:type II secretory pathway component HofQ